MRIRTHSPDWGKRCYAHFILLYSVHSKSDGYDLCRSAEWLFWPERNFWWLYWVVPVLATAPTFFRLKYSCCWHTFYTSVRQFKGTGAREKFSNRAGGGGVESLIRTMRCLIYRGMFTEFCFKLTLQCIIDIGNLDSFES